MKIIINDASQEDLTQSSWPPKDFITVRFLRSSMNKGFYEPDPKEEALDSISVEKAEEIVKHQYKYDFNYKEGLCEDEDMKKIIGEDNECMWYDVTFPMGKSMGIKYGQIDQGEGENISHYFFVSEFTKDEAQNKGYAEKSKYINLGDIIYSVNVAERQVSGDEVQGKVGEKQMHSIEVNNMGIKEIKKKLKEKNKLQEVESKIKNIESIEPDLNKWEKDKLYREKLIELKHKKWIEQNKKWIEQNKKKVSEKIGDDYKDRIILGDYAKTEMEKVLTIFKEIGPYNPIRFIRKKGSKKPEETKIEESMKKLLKVIDDGGNISEEAKYIVNKKRYKYIEGEYSDEYIKEKTTRSDGILTKNLHIIDMRDKDPDKKVVWYEITFTPKANTKLGMNMNERKEYENFGQIPIKFAGEGGKIGILEKSGFVQEKDKIEKVNNIDFGLVKVFGEYYNEALKILKEEMKKGPFTIRFLRATENKKTELIENMQRIEKELKPEEEDEKDEEKTDEKDEEKNDKEEKNLLSG